MRGIGLLELTPGSVLEAAASLTGAMALRVMPVVTFAIVVLFTATLDAQTVTEDVQYKTDGVSVEVTATYAASDSGTAQSEDTNWWYVGDMGDDSTYPPAVIMCANSALDTPRVAVYLLGIIDPDADSSVVIDTLRAASSRSEATSSGELDPSYTFPYHAVRFAAVDTNASDATVNLWLWYNERK